MTEQEQRQALIEALLGLAGSTAGQALTAPNGGRFAQPNITPQGRDRMMGGRLDPNWQAHQWPGTLEHSRLNRRPNLGDVIFPWLHPDAQRKKFEAP